ncbi:MAG: DNA-formamidopyrimidine glycosylase family protein [Gammaproteobacteria bacterium]
MPELPEVETLRRELESTVCGARIEAVDLRWRSFLITPRGTPDSEIPGQRIIAIRRRGKELVFDLDRDWHLLLHLKMTGQVVVQRRGKTVAYGGYPTRNLRGPMPNSWTRVIFVLSGSRSLFINDLRKFARLRPVTSAALQSDPFLSRMGPEPLGRGFTLAGFRQQLSRNRFASIKAVLLD